MKILPAEFESLTIRRVYDEATETWSFSVIDNIQVLTQQPDYQGARKYWKVLKGRLAKEGSQLVSSCYQLKLPAGDGKLRAVELVFGMCRCTSKGERHQGELDEFFHGHTHHCLRSFSSPLPHCKEYSRTMPPPRAVNRLVTTRGSLVGQGTL